MENPDSIRRRVREAEAREAKARVEREASYNRNRPEQSEFHETLAAPIPNRTYRSEIDRTESHTNIAEQIVRAVATTLGVLLALRFITSLFSANRDDGLVNAIYTLTDWIVQPFQAVLGGAPTSTSGFFDWAALAALVVLSILAAFIGRLIRTPRV
jgi:uncharacterized protein YggT (Ycf19 family)